MLTSQTHDYTLYTLHAIYTLYNLSSWPDSRLLGRQACVLVLPGISDIINFSMKHWTQIDRNNDNSKY